MICRGFSANNYPSLIFHLTVYTNLREKALYYVLAWPNRRIWPASGAVHSRGEYKTSGSQPVFPGEEEITAKILNIG